MATAAQKARETTLRQKTAQLTQSLKTATGSKAQAMQGSLDRYNKALSSIRSTPTATKPTATPSYSYASGSAQGPASFQQAQTAMQTNTPVNIPISTPTNFSNNQGVANVVTPTGNAGEQNNLAGNVPPANNNYFDTINKMSSIYPQTPQQQPYQSPFMDSLNKTLGAITGFQGQQYQPDQDIGLKQAQEQAINQTMRQAARRNMLYSEGTKTRSQQAAQQLIPQYQERFEDRQQQELDNLYRTLGAVGSMDDRAYRQYQGQTGQAQTDYLNRIRAFEGAQGLAEGMYDRQASQQEASQQAGEDTREKYKDMFGRYLSDREIGYADAYANASPQGFEYLDQFQGDYKAQINALEAAGVPDDDPRLQMLHGARMHKIQNDFEMGMLYGKDYGLEPSQKEQKEYFDVIMKDYETQVKALTAGNEITESELELDKLRAEIMNKNVSTQEKMEMISQMGDKLADMKQRTAIAQQTANTGAARLSLSQNRLAFDKKKQELKVQADLDKTQEDTFDEIEGAMKYLYGRKESTLSAQDARVWLDKQFDDGLDEEVYIAMMKLYDLEDVTTQQNVSDAASYAGSMPLSSYMP